MTMICLLQELRKDYVKNATSMSTYITGNLFLSPGASPSSSVWLTWGCLNGDDTIEPMTPQVQIEAWKEVDQNISYPFEYLLVPEQATCMLLMEDTTIVSEIYFTEKTDLLPPNATALERSLSLTAARLADLSLQILPLWRIDRCPPQVLPWFAWLFAVEEWTNSVSDALPLPVQRSMITASVQTHRCAGTVGGLKSGLAGLGVNAQVLEWWQQQPQGTPHSFTISLILNEDSSKIYAGNIDNTLYEKIINVASANSPLSKRFTLELQANLEGSMSIAVLAYVAEILHINGSFTKPQST